MPRNAIIVTFWEKEIIIFTLANKSFPPGDWIDSYAAHELQKLLSDQHLTLTDIEDAMHFSSQPALTRYMKRVMSTTPSEYRKNSL